MTTGPKTAVVLAAELDALLAIERAATVLAAGDLADPHEAEQVHDALPHLLEDLALTRPVTSPVTALADARAARTARALRAANLDVGRVLAVGPLEGAVRAGLDEAHAQDRWVAEMAARGALTSEHRAAYSALVDAGMRPHQLRFLANAITCGVAAPSTEKES